MSLPPSASRCAPLIEQVVDGKRVAGYQVVPIEALGITYRVDSHHVYAVHDHTIIGRECLATATNQDGVILWQTCYSRDTYIPGFETDVQDVFPVDLSIEGEHLIIKHEYYQHDPRRIFILHRGTGELMRGT